MNNVNTKNDTISRRAAIDAADRADYTGLAVEDVKKVTDEVIKELKQLPLVQPKIVRCADCQKYIDYRCRDEHANLNDWRHEEDYCSFGKRREDDHETD